MPGCGAHIARLTVLWATCIATTSCALQKAIRAPILTIRHSLTLPAWSIMRGGLMRPC
uniref:Uncharacterized protein n=2 Tax=unclassified Caudoviricetes TaxID=2788787 RepID=A0A8S5NNI3_9CAUD|nr:MAG TPA: hypothetical protein [Myoviridae sp. ctzRR1]DAD96265.1 MAG TPA: hypothetical protein [Myoviridae sp. ct0mM28]